jgi:hypothetical protein
VWRALFISSTASLCRTRICAWTRGGLGAVRIAARLNAIPKEVTLTLAQIEAIIGARLSVSTCHILTLIRHAVPSGARSCSDRLAGALAHGRTDRSVPLYRAGGVSGARAPHPADHIPPVLLLARHFSAAVHALRFRPCRAVDEVAARMLGARWLSTLTVRCGEQAQRVGISR